MSEEELRAEYSDVMVEYLQNTLDKTRHMWGKLALRFAAQGLLPNDIAWRQKTDLQFGSGSDKVQDLLESTITDREFALLQADGRVLYNKAHGALLKMFVDQGLEPHAPEGDEYACVGCTGAVPAERHHCATCGAYPADVPPNIQS